VDGGPADSDKGLSNQIYEDIRIEGNLNCPLVRVENRPYPFGATASQNGSSYGIVLRNVSLEGTQSGLSSILGKDVQNGHHDYLFENLKINGTQITASNYASFFSINQFVSNINFIGSGFSPDINNNGIPDLWETSAYWRLLHAAGNPLGVEKPWSMDSDGDSACDALELATGTSPMSVRERPMLETTMVDGALMVNYRQRSGGSGTTGIDYNVNGLIYAVEVSSDLVTWHRGATWVEAVGTPVSNGDGSETALIRIKDTAESSAFVRLGVNH